ncbi:MAG: pyruvate kinase, partial [Phycisphaerales bacterium]|nr:pyruvate kinase [Phycisphaerales bacterium]
PDSRLSVPALTEKDRRDLEWAIDNNLDYVALSFVRHPDDLRELRRIIDERKSKLNVIVKIEKSEALEHLDELVALSDGVMVARGDLGVEMDVWRVPLVQKALTARCREAGKPVIVATQMLQSMVSTPTPTRAEVSDVANAIFDATDAVMLSAETASGEYPIEAVEMMRRVAVTTEAYRRGELRPEPARSVSAHYRSTSAIANGAAEVALSLNARLVAVWSTSGETVRLVASRRLPMPVVGLTHDERVYRQLNLLYGVFPLRVPPMRNPIEMAATLDERLVSAGLAGVGDLVVVVTSTNPTTSGNTDTTLVHRVQAR